VGEVVVNWGGKRKFYFYTVLVHSHEQDRRASTHRYDAPELLVEFRGHLSRVVKERVQILDLGRLSWRGLAAIWQGCRGREFLACGEHALFVPKLTFLVKVAYRGHGQLSPGKFESFLLELSVERVR
jgi:hypothetical protein